MKRMNWMLTGVLTVLVGCSDTELPESTKSVETPADVRYVATAEPTGAVPVGEARESVQERKW